MPPLVPPAAGPVPPEDGPVYHRRNRHGAVAAIPTAVAEAVDPAEQDEQHNEQNDSGEQGDEEGTSARLAPRIKEKMGFREEGQYALVPFPGHSRIREAAADILPLLTVEPAGEAAV